MPDPRSKTQLRANVRHAGRLGAAVLAPFASHGAAGARRRWQKRVRRARAICAQIARRAGACYAKATDFVTVFER